MRDAERADTEFGMETKDRALAPHDSVACSGICITRRDPMWILSAC